MNRESRSEGRRVKLGGEYLSESDLNDCGFRRVGTNVRIHSRASIYGVENISIGDNVRIDDFTIIIATGPVEIGSFVSIPNFCYVGARHGLSVDDFVTFAPGVKIFTASDDYLGDKLTGPVVPRQFTGGKQGGVKLGKHVIIGAGTVVLPGCMIGEGASVGALSLVVADLEPWSVYAGIPVRRIKDRKKGPLLLEQELRKTIWGPG